ncbi:MAG: 50S ribosomal protein L10 [bacterium]|nr:50S ribosomal protein L10 [bacterium]
MAITRQKKEEIIKNITEAVKNATSLVFVKFDKLSVARANELRRSLKDKGVKYLVVKKTLLKRVLGSVTIEGALPDLDGEVALAYGPDLIEPAKNIATFEKKFEQTVFSLGGILGSKYLAREEIVALARIPSRQILLGQFVTVINAPIQNTVGVLHNTIRSFVVALNQITQSKN